jgi:glutaredoxin-related protein
MPLDIPEPTTTEPVTRPLLPSARVTAAAKRVSAAYQVSVVAEVERALLSSNIVVIGMAWNSHVRNVRRALADAGLTFQYLEYGNYLSMWRVRLAIKLWSGWPTFPQVFVRGVLFGGEDLTIAALADGTLRAALEAPPTP